METNIDWREIVKNCFEGEFDEVSFEKAVDDFLEKGKDPHDFLQILVVKFGGRVSKINFPSTHLKNLNDLGTKAKTVSFVANIYEIVNRGELNYFYIHDGVNLAIMVGKIEDSSDLIKGNTYNFQNVKKAIKGGRSFLYVQDSISEIVEMEFEEEFWGDNNPETAIINFKDIYIEKIENRSFDKEGQVKEFHSIRAKVDNRTTFLTDWDKNHTFEEGHYYNLVAVSKVNSRGKSNFVIRPNTLVIKSEKEPVPPVEEVVTFNELYTFKNYPTTTANQTFVFKGIITRTIKFSENGNLLCIFDDMTETIGCIISKQILEGDSNEEKLQNFEKEYLFYLINGKGRTFGRSGSEWLIFNNISKEHG